MPQHCSLCIHAQRSEIDSELATGTSYRNMAERFGTSLGALNRHKAHIAQAIVKAQETRELESGETSLDAMRRMNRKAWELLRKAESEGDYRGAIVALREARECLETQDKMLAAAGQGETLRVEIADISTPDTCPHCGKPLEPVKTVEVDYNVSPSPR